eukprot:3932372-Rhodomonas_salina.2
MQRNARPSLRLGLWGWRPRGGVGVGKGDEARVRVEELFPRIAAVDRHAQHFDALCNPETKCEIERTSRCRDAPRLRLCREDVESAATRCSGCVPCKAVDHQHVQHFDAVRRREFVLGQESASRTCVRERRVGARLSCVRAQQPDAQAVLCTAVERHAQHFDALSLC